MLTVTRLCFSQWLTLDAVARVLVETAIVSARTLATASTEAGSKFHGNGIGGECCPTEVFGFCIKHAIWI